MMSDAQIIADLVDKLGLALADVARIFIDAQTKIAMIDLALMIFVIISTIAFFYSLLNYIYKYQEKTDGAISLFELEVFVPTLALTFLWLIIIMVVFIVLRDSLLRLLAPEYMGLKSMIAVLKP